MTSNRPKLHAPLSFSSPVARGEEDAPQSVKQTCPKFVDYLFFGEYTQDETSFQTCILFDTSSEYKLMNAYFQILWPGLWLNA